MAIMARGTVAILGYGSYTVFFGRAPSGGFFFSSRRRHTRFSRDWSSDVCSSDLEKALALEQESPPAVIDLEQVRNDYRGLLASYGKLAESLATLNLAAPAGFREQIGRASCRERE